MKTFCRSEAFRERLASCFTVHRDQEQHPNQIPRPKILQPNLEKGRYRDHKRAKMCHIRRLSRESAFLAARAHPVGEGPLTEALGRQLG